MKDNGFIKELWPWCLFVLALLACFAFAGCKETERFVYITNHDTVETTRWKVDSVDRWRTHYEYIKGDSIILIDSINIYKYIAVHDTMEKIVVNDSIVYQDRVVEKKKLVWWPVWMVLGVGVAFVGVRKLGVRS